MRDAQDDCKLEFGTFGSVTTGPVRKLDPPHCVQLLNTGNGDNFVRAEDGTFDGIDCFGRRDRIIVDQYDHVSACDVVKCVRR